MPDGSKIARAEASFKALQQADKQEARRQYETDQIAVREKTARLRALRLAKEAAEAANATLAKRVAKGISRGRAPK